MARFPIALPRGIFRNGTRFQAKGRYYDAWGVRWYGSGIGPINGWTQKGSSAVTGLARAAVAWKSDDAQTWLGIGTESNWYVCDRSAAITDITPVGFLPGRADAIAGGGYGTLDFGEDLYGTPRADDSLVIDATMWTQALWGQDLLGVSPDDRKLYEWVAPTTGTPGAQVLNSPECDAVVVTPERFVFALATSDPRTVDWCDQENNTVWNDLPTNQAGSVPLTTGGRLMCGAAVKDVTLLFTDLDVHAAQYIGGTLVYSFTEVGDGCGIISRGAMAVFGTGEAAWMSQNLTFWVWNGATVSPLDCDVLDYIRKDINRLQISKIVAILFSPSFEIEFQYCSANSTEIDRAVVWNFKEGYWNIGREPRTCGVDKGVFQYPLRLSSDGKIYNHEVGWDYGSSTPYITSGPIELGNGDNIMYVMGLYPDDDTVGDVTASFTVRRNADDVGTSYGPYDLTQKTDLRFSGGQVEVTFTGASMADWRVGTPKLELLQGEGRG